MALIVEYSGLTVSYEDAEDDTGEDVDEMFEPGSVARRFMPNQKDAKPEVREETVADRTNKSIDYGEDYFHGKSYAEILCPQCESNFIHNGEELCDSCLEANGQYVDEADREVPAKQGTGAEETQTEAPVDPYVPVQDDVPEEEEEQPYIPPAPTFGIEDGTLIVGVDTTAVTISVTDGSEIYYSINAGDFVPYTEPVDISESGDASGNVAIEAFALDVAGGETGDSAFAAYTLKCAPPVFSDTTAAKDNPFDLGITSATAGATVYYTAGLTPDAPDNTGETALPLSLDGGIGSGETSVTVKAIAYKTGCVPSEVATSVTFAFKCKTPVISDFYNLFLTNIYLTATSTDGSTINWELQQVYYGTSFEDLQQGTCPSGYEEFYIYERWVDGDELRIKANATKDNYADGDWSDWVYGDVTW
jgi:hypothetical protein